jgi:endonuclease G
VRHKGLNLVKLRGGPLALAMATLCSIQAIAKDAELHTFHCLHSCPIAASGSNDIVVRENYTLSSNDLTKMADWVAYRITPETIGPSSTRQWKADPWLDQDETLAPSHYTSANETLNVDRGHQAPLAAFSGTKTASETNYLSNITPQSSALNQGPWVRLENKEREAVQRLSKSLYVLTGPLFERMMEPLPNGGEYHRVPSGYWKVIATDDGRISSFIFDQSAKRDDDHCRARVTLRHLELRARLKLFPRLTSSLSPLDKELGCMAAPSADPAPSRIAK